MTTIRLLRSRSARVRFAAALTWDHVPKCLIYDLRAETAEEYGRRSNRAEGSAVARASPEQTIALVLEALDTLFSERDHKRAAITVFDDYTADPDAVVAASSPSTSSA